jgi:hypothetical protein
LTLAIIVYALIVIQLSQEKEEIYDEEDEELTDSNKFSIQNCLDDDQVSDVKSPMSGKLPSMISLEESEGFI